MSLLYVSVIFSVIGAPSIVIFLMQWDLAQILKPSIASACVNNTDKEIYKANAFYIDSFQSTFPFHSCSSKSRNQLIISSLIIKINKIQQGLI